MGSKRRDEFVENYRVRNSDVCYTTKRGTAREHANYSKQNPESIKDIAKRLASKGIAISLATLLAVSGISGCLRDYSNEKTNSIPIEEVAKNRRELKRLGIKEEDFEELKELKEGINSNESNPNILKEYQDRLERVSLNIGKSKIASSIPQLDTGRISLIYNYETNSSPAWQAVVIRNESSKYQSYDTNGIGYDDYVCASIPDAKHKIDEKISKYIVDIAKLQSLKEPTITDLKEAINNIEQFSCYNIEFKDGNLEAGSDIIQDIIQISENENDER